MDQSTTLQEQSHVAMSMEDFHCETFEMRINFEVGKMDTAAFLKVLSERGTVVEPDDDGDIKVSLTFPSPADTKSDYHAHLKFDLWNNGRGRTVLSYHAGETEKGATSQINASDCAKWLGEFCTDKVSAHVHINYTFDDSFTTAVPIPFPLVISGPLAGSLVSGLALVLPNDATTAILQKIDEGIYVFLRREFEIDLREFNLFTELEKLSPTVDSLIEAADTK